MFSFNYSLTLLSLHDFLMYTFSEILFNTKDVLWQYNCLWNKYLKKKLNCVHLIDIIVIQVLHSLLQGVYHSLCIYFIAFGVLSCGQGSDGKGITDIQFFSSVVQASVILVVTIQVCTSFWFTYLLVSVLTC